MSRNNSLLPRALNLDQADISISHCRTHLVLSRDIPKLLPTSGPLYKLLFLPEVPCSLVVGLAHSSTSPEHQLPMGNLPVFSRPRVSIRAQSTVSSHCPCLQEKSLREWESA